MTSAEMWQLAYLIAISRGCSGIEASDIAYQAVVDWEDYEKDMA